MTTNTPTGDQSTTWIFPRESPETIKRRVARALEGPGEGIPRDVRRLSPDGKLITESDVMTALERFDEAALETEHALTPLLVAEQHETRLVEQRVFGAVARSPFRTAIQRALAEEPAAADWRLPLEPLRANLRDARIALKRASRFKRQRALEALAGAAQALLDDGVARIAERAQRLAIAGARDANDQALEALAESRRTLADPNGSAGKTAQLRARLQQTAIGRGETRERRHSSIAPDRSVIESFVRFDCSFVSQTGEIDTKQLWREFGGWASGHGRLPAEAGRLADELAHFFAEIMVTRLRGVGLDELYNAAGKPIPLADIARASSPPERIDIDGLDGVQALDIRYAEVPPGVGSLGDGWRSHPGNHQRLLMVQETAPVTARALLGIPGGGWPDVLADVEGVLAEASTPQLQHAVAERRIFERFNGEVWDPAEPQPSEDAPESDTPPSPAGPGPQEPGPTFSPTVDGTPTTVPDDEGDGAERFGQGEGESVDSTVQAAGSANADAPGAKDAREFSRDNSLLDELLALGLPPEADGRGNGAD